MSLSPECQTVLGGVLQDVVLRRHSQAAVCSSVDAFASAAKGDLSPGAVLVHALARRRSKMADAAQDYEDRHFVVPHTMLELLREILKE